MKNYIKIFDEGIAEALCRCGFSYIKQKISASQTAFAFEDSEDLENTIAKFQKENYQDFVYVKDSVLFF